MPSPAEVTIPAPLRGVTILSLAEQLPGPYATLLLADLGADVILVERPGTGDPARTLPAFFEALSRNKRSVALDLKNADGKARFMKLVSAADVVIEGYSPGTASRLGIDYEALRGVNESLIYASISGFGQTGPYRDRAAHDISYQGLSGFLSDQASKPGITPGFPIGDIGAAMFAALAVVAALHGRQQTGLGTFIDVSLADSLVSWMTPVLGPLMNGGEKMNVMHSPGYGTFQCSDGRVLTLSIAHEDHFWRSLCAVLELPALADVANPERMRQAQALRSELAARIATAALETWGAKFDKARVPWSPVNAEDDVPRDPHFVARRLFGQWTARSGATRHYVRHPVQFSAYPPIEPQPAPTLGQHNANLLGSQFGGA